MSKTPIKIYHNARCSKSRDALCLLQNEDVEIIEYLKNPPSEEELQQLVALLNIKPMQLVRTKEEVFQKHYAHKAANRVNWIKVMAKYPVLIERPIVIKNGKAIIARPPERVLELK
ncbi:MAG: arsenate reductase (glutaredoxin) [Flavobacteriales bacterium]|nr:arsenate reductase (glutaredoxin) [Flavobacteriales bacterium]